MPMKIARWPLDVPKNGSGLVARAYALIDPNKVSSAFGVVSLFDRDVEAIRANERLSDIARRQDTSTAARSRLQNNLPSLAREVEKLETEYRAHVEQAHKLPEATQNDTLIDIALANQIRERKQSTNAKDFVVLPETLSERQRLAIARLPEELSGLWSEAREKMRNSLLPASKALELNNAYAAIANARQNVQRAIDALVANSPDVPHRDLVSWFGDSWQLGGVVTPEERRARVEKMLSGNAA